MAFGDKKSLGARRRNRRRPQLILLSVCLVFLLIVSNGSTLMNSARQVATDISVPLTYIVTLPVVLVRDTIFSVSDYLTLRQTNETLQSENMRLLRYEDEVARLRDLVRNYEGLLKVQLPEDYDAVTAHVLADTGGSFVRTLVINAGYDSGVRVGYAVVGTRGLIGRVVSVGTLSSRVLLVTDLNSRIPVRIEPIGENAVMSGDNTATPRLTYIDKQTELVNGMRIVASGLGGEVPAGLTVGRVRLDRNNAPAVIPVENFDNLEFVRVLRFKPFDDVLAEEFPTALVERKLVPLPAPQSRPRSHAQSHPHTQAHTQAPTQVQAQAGGE